MKIISALSLLFGLNISSNGQTDKTVVYQDQVWTGIVVNFNSNNRHVLTCELENRVFVSPYKQSTTLCRLNYRIPLNNTLSYSVGFANFYQWSQNEFLGNGDFAVPEYRPHIDIYHQHNSFHKKWIITGRLRNEYRLFHNTNSTELAPGFNGYFRTRYRIIADYSIKENARHQLLLRFGGEVHFNTGKEIVYNHFDQLRIISGIHLKINPLVQLGTEYIYWFQQRTSKNSFYQRDIFRISLNFTFTSKEMN